MLLASGPPIIFLHQIRCKITRISPKKSEIIRANPRGTRAKHAAQTKYQRFNVSRTIKSSADASAQILQAMRARFARKFCRKSPKPARFSLKNRAHFRRATCSTITKIAVINASSRRGSYINPAHVLYSLCVRGAPILHRIQRKITRVSPKKIGNHPRKSARNACQTCGTNKISTLQCFTDH